MTSPIPCKNPCHPSFMDKRVMTLVRDTPTEEVWACKACMEIHKVMSIQVRTKSKYRQHVRQQLQREGRLLTSPVQTSRPKFYK